MAATLSDLSFPHFRGNRRRRLPRKWGRVASGGLVAASCIPDRDKPGTSPAEDFTVKPWRLPTYKAGRSPNTRADVVSNTLHLLKSADCLPEDPQPRRDCLASPGHVNWTEALH